MVSQLNVAKCKASFSNYWDQQLLVLIKHGFPLDFDRNCLLYSEFKSHTSVVDFRSDVIAYLDEDI